MISCTFKKQLVNSITNKDKRAQLNPEEKRWFTEIKSVSNIDIDTERELILSTKTSLE